MKERDIHVGDIVEKQENTGWVHEYLVIYKQPDYAVTLRLTQERTEHNENPVSIGVQYTDAGKVGYTHYNEMLRISWHIPEEDVNRVKAKVRTAVGLDDVPDTATRVQELREDLRLKEAIIANLEKEIARLKEDVRFYRDALTVKTAEPKKKKGFFAFLRKKVLA